MPAADFAWLARAHWSLWLAAVCAGAPTAYAECAGILCHFRHEALAGKAVREPVTMPAARVISGYAEEAGEPDADAMGGRGVIPARPGCPHCGCPEVTRDREDTVPVRYIDGGVAKVRDGRVLRVVCRSPACGRNGTVHDPVDVAAGRALRDHVVARLFAVGQTEAARETGLGRATVQRHAEAWAAPREAEAAAAAPGFLAFASTRLRGEETVIVADADRRTVVEMLPVDGLGAWLAKAGRLPALRACIPVDARIRDTVLRALPGAEAMLAPATAGRAVRSRALLALRAVRRREGGRGSNGFPRAHEFALAIEGPWDTGGWPSSVVRLLRAARAALALLACVDRQSGERAWPGFEEAAAAPSAKPVLGFMREWREPILEGLAHRFLDGLVASVDAVRRGLSARRPALGLADLRRYAVLRTFERRTEGSGRVPVSRGASIAGLRLELAAAP